NLEAVQNVTMTLVFPLTFLSSAFVPTQTMPGLLRIFVAHQPMTQVVDAVRALVLAYPVGPGAWLAAAWSLAIVAVFAPIPVHAYGRGTTRSRRDRHHKALGPHPRLLWRTRCCSERYTSADMLRPTARRATTGMAPPS